MKDFITLRQHERLDDLQYKGLHLIQDPSIFCFGIDAVLLSDFATVREGERVLDFCTGSGIIPLLLSVKTKAKHITGFEIQKQSVDMARRSVLLNELQERITIIEGDIKDLEGVKEMGKFDVVTCNPPYMNTGGGLLNPNQAKAIARHEILCNLEDVIRATKKALPPKGRFYMIHRPHRLTDIFTLCRSYNLEPKRMRMVHSYIDAEPSMVLIECVDNGKAMLKVEKPLIIYETNEDHTQEILNIYERKGI